ncbi:MAG: hypothetical protein EOM25_07360 [Deltaproteobacteria bacterium]|nr:hypothetical protein [Deltaproteobacteria bacterium]
METIFALVVLVLLILMTAQLFMLGDKTMVTLNEAFRKTLREAHDLDGSPEFRLVEVTERASVETLPGLQWTLGHLGSSEVPASFDLQRSMAVYAGSFQGRGESAYAFAFRYILWSKGMQGRRPMSVLKTLVR